MTENEGLWSASDLSGCEVAAPASDNTARATVNAWCHSKGWQAPTFRWVESRRDFDIFCGGKRVGRLVKV